MDKSTILLWTRILFIFQQNCNSFQFGKKVISSLFNIIRQTKDVKIVEDNKYSVNKNTLDLLQEFGFSAEDCIGQVWFIYSCVYANDIAFQY